jgi:hypothetical protein
MLGGELGDYCRGRVDPGFTGCGVHRSNELVEAGTRLFHPLHVSLHLTLVFLHHGLMLRIASHVILGERAASRRQGERQCDHESAGDGMSIHPGLSFAVV